jgi:hypothetical protein
LVELVSSGNHWLCPSQVLGGKPRPDIFQKLLKKRLDQIPTEETVAEKVLGLMQGLKKDG